MKVRCLKIGCIIAVLMMAWGCVSASNKNKTSTMVVSDGNGNKQSKTVSTFDGQGNLIQSKSETGVISYVYENGDCVQIVDGDIVTNNSYKNHKLSKREVFQKDSKISSTIFIYDGSGNQIQESTIDSRLGKSEQITRVYNDNNLLVKIINQKINNEISVTLNEHDNQGNVITASTYVDEKLVSVSRFEYKNKLLVKEEAERKDTATCTVTEYSYDSKNNLLEKRTTVGQSSKPKMIITYSYSE